MTPENFCYWLQGKLELDKDNILTIEQVLIIREHLKLVFKKETPINIPNFWINRDLFENQESISFNNSFPSC